MQRQHFVVLNQATLGAEPTKGAFDDPAPLLHCKATVSRLFLHNLESHATFLSAPLLHPTLVASINPHQAQLFSGTASPTGALPQPTRALGIGYIGWRDKKFQRQALGIGQDMPLAPFDLLAAIKAAHSCTRGGFDTLAILAARRWMLMSPHLVAQRNAQHMMEAAPEVTAAPTAKVVVDQSPLGKLARQQTPLHARRHEITQGIENAPLPNATRTPTCFSGQQRSDKLPLSIGEIG